MSIKLNIVLLLLSLSVGACTFFMPRQDEEAVARVHGNYLYRSDLEGAIPEGASVNDSTTIAQRLIDAWVRDQLMLNQAENALSEEQLDVERKIEEYRTSLLIYSYKQKLLLQKMDTIISNVEIQAYYEENQGNFILDQEVVKAIFVKVPLTAPEISNVRRWTRSATMEDLDNLEKYSINHAHKFDLFNNSWIYLEDLLGQVPLKISNTGRYVQYNRNIETTDSLFHYFVHIIDYKLEGDLAPLDLKEEDIKSILLNKRKIEFYNNLESQVYTEGLNKNQFEIY